MSKFIKSFVKDERGVTAIEYALIAGLIAVAIASSVTSVTTQLNIVFKNIVTALT